MTFVSTPHHHGMQHDATLCPSQLITIIWKLANDHAGCTQKAVKWLQTLLFKAICANATSSRARSDLYTRRVRERGVLTFKGPALPYRMLWGLPRQPSASHGNLSALPSSMSSRNNLHYIHQPDQLKIVPYTHKHICHRPQTAPCLLCK